MTLALMVIIGFPVLATVIWLVRLGGPHFYFYVWLFLCVVSVVMMVVYPTFIAPLFNQYTKLDEGPIYAAIEKLANKVSFPLTQIYVVDGSKRSAHSNAYFYGFFGVCLCYILCMCCQVIDLKYQDAAIGLTTCVRHVLCCWVVSCRTSASFCSTPS